MGQAFPALRGRSKQRPYKAGIPNLRSVFRGIGSRPSSGLRAGPSGACNDERGYAVRSHMLFFGLPKQTNRSLLMEE